jgi:hypothetical protein
LRCAPPTPIEQTRSSVIAERAGPAVLDRRRRQRREVAQQRGTHEARGASSACTSIEGAPPKRYV